MRKALAICLALMLTVSLAGCAKAAEKVAEKAAENAIEQQSGGTADVDMSDNGGTVKVETQEGTAIIGGGDIPDSIDVELPSGGNVISSFETDTGDSVLIEYAGASFDDIVASLQSWIDDQSEDFTGVSSSGEGFQIQTWASNTSAITVQTCTVTDGGEGVCVAVQQDNS